VKEPGGDNKEYLNARAIVIQIHIM